MNVSCPCNPPYTQLHSNIIFPARHCSNSCFGKSSQNKGIRRFQCAGSDCSTFRREGGNNACGNDAGIECSKYVEHNYIYIYFERYTKRWSVSIAKYALVPCYKDLSIAQECSLKRGGHTIACMAPNGKQINTACA